jgi:RimJ/RimL family protein N-acetyltransferase
VNVELLRGIRVRTPRLELRLPSQTDIEDLYRVAEAGIHPPGEMPFFFAWTDNLEHDNFVAYHWAALREWQPALWECHFVTFADGRVIGTQNIGAKNFSEDREVNTGSWLGMPFQRQGYGFEQRAAVLEFAFGGLGAQTATSGALEHNVASQRISDKLGYRRSGTTEAAPRGEPVIQFDYRLERDEWRCPIDVRIEALEPALALFGAAPQPG